MQATIPLDAQWRRLLQPLLGVRHTHLRPLVGIGLGGAGMKLHYGQPGPCPPMCTGLWGTVRAVHSVGLWIGDVMSAVEVDDQRRPVIAGVGSRWVLDDPFAAHPSAQDPDLRIRWRQRSDLRQLSALDTALTDCPA